MEICPDKKDYVTNAQETDGLLFLKFVGKIFWNSKIFGSILSDSTFSFEN